ncbi:GNAT family N-acetyltransferase [Rhodopirellula sp. P2]|uniref:GNAT family N-acetyltransferase n=1 Tax=Rhodopirellula sp. P2 TaxID=2127060 RepID=UPI00236841DA|nr:GNAT family N-acetyltransferase [Rhodopirellula sp. P2]WDQ17860.1 GNAT family N-acetyltransferase [Rhodopirellula sp. P2]
MSTETNPSNDSQPAKLDVEILRVDYTHEPHRKSLLRLLSEYANDPAIGSPGLSKRAQQRVATELAQRPNAVSLFAMINHPNNRAEAIGLANCFEVFSTFAAAPVLNVHDVMVSAPHRGKGVGSILMQAITELANERNCCKVTLEVYRGNQPARSLYSKNGFAGTEMDSELGETLFLSKRLVGDE